MAGEPIYIKMPRIVKVDLQGTLPIGVSAKDIVLEMLRRETVKGGVGKIYEYTGEGLSCLSIYDRSYNHKYGCRNGRYYLHIPSDEVVHQFFINQQRGRRLD